MHLSIHERGSESIGAMVKDVTLMKKVAGEQMRIKATGRIYTLDFASDLMRAGTDRLGTSKAPRLTIS